MRSYRILIQTCVCLAVFFTAQSGILTKDNAAGDKFGEAVSKITEAIRENYTLAELLELGDKAVESAAEAPDLISQAVLSANSVSKKIPLGDDGTVYASEGGNVLKAGVSQKLGRYIVIEHPGILGLSGKISIYGHLEAIQAVSGERVAKGMQIGTYNRESGDDFYYTIEDKSGILS